jgi:2-polyprenyl-3-methyl-5-hydroxy-6-metoxy-1,4-benzoquinol methylase
MWSKKIQHIIDYKAEGYHYNKIPIYCMYGVHEKVADFIDKKFSKDARILILGAGAGAFDERIIDMGYKNITSIEFRPEIYRARGKVIGKDLNQDFSDLGDENKFDCVVAIEIVEHLENHFHFIRNIEKLLKDNGMLYITTPNVESSLSRVKYFLTGFLDLFSAKDVDVTGHINPIFKHIFLYHLKNNTTLNLMSIDKNRSVWEMDNYPNLKIKCVIIVARLLSLFIKNGNDGQINIFSIQKSKRQN